MKGDTDMIIKPEQKKTEIRENMRGGDGAVKITHHVDASALYEKGRLFATLTLEKDCGIGYHTHETDSEIFVVTSGTAEYNDNGEVSTVCTGDVLVCKKGEGHSIKNIGDEPVNLTALIIYA
jgi:quercetin dioxygenase-like cupin family protein